MIWTRHRNGLIYLKNGSHRKDKEMLTGSEWLWRHGIEKSWNLVLGFLKINHFRIRRIIMDRLNKVANKLRGVSNTVAFRLESIKNMFSLNFILFSCSNYNNVKHTRKCITKSFYAFDTKIFPFNVLLKKY